MLESAKLCGWIKLKNRENTVCSGINHPASINLVYLFSAYKFIYLKIFI